MYNYSLSNSLKYYEHLSLYSDSATTTRLTDAWGMLMSWFEHSRRPQLLVFKSRSIK